MKHFVAAIAVCLLTLAFAPGAGQPKNKDLKKVEVKDKKGKAKTKPIDGGVKGRQKTTFTFTLENFECLRTRALPRDTIHVAFMLEAAGTTYGPVVKHMGRSGAGTRAVNLSFAGVDKIRIAGKSAVTMTYIIVNAGKTSNAEIRTALKKASNHLMELKIDEFEGYNNLFELFVGTFDQWDTALIDEDCDGVVAADRLVLDARDIYAAKNVYKETRQYSGTTAPAGCGVKSMYKVTWSVSRKTVSKGAK